MVTCCFAGHRIAPRHLMSELVSAVEQLIRHRDHISFYSGGMGDFDNMCEGAVREVRERYSEKEIRLYRVLPAYQYAPTQAEQAYLSKLFDDIFVCDASDGAHYKSMISKRNRWMVEQSEYMIAYVLNTSGGAYSSLRYAQKRNLKIIRIGCTQKPN